MPSLNQMILMLRNNLKGLSRIEEHDLSINCKAIRDSAISKYVIRNRIHHNVGLLDQNGFHLNFTEADIIRF